MLYFFLIGTYSGGGMCTARKCEVVENLHYDWCSFNVEGLSSTHILVLHDILLVNVVVVYVVGLNQPSLLLGFLVKSQLLKVDAQI